MTECASDSDGAMRAAKERFDGEFFAITASLDLIDDPEFMHFEELAIWEEFFSREPEPQEDVCKLIRNGRILATRLG